MWFREIQKDVGITLKAKKIFSKKSKYQKIEIFDTSRFGRMLVLDGAVQLTEKDEFIYHEMITHVPLITHPNPKKILIVGGGDGGTVREVLKHKVKEINLVEVDEEVIKTAKKYLPFTSKSFSNPKVKVFIQDGKEFIKKNKGYDIIIADLPDPIGFAKALFTKSFYEDVFRALKKDGIMVTQSESPFYEKAFIKRIFSSLKQIFPIVKVYIAPIPTYPSGLWSFTLASKRFDPLKIDKRRGSRIRKLKTKYYSKNIHLSSFSLPRFLEEFLG